MFGNHKRKSTKIRALRLALTAAAAAMSLFAQAIPPTQDPLSNDKGCLGHSTVRVTGGIQYETFMGSAIDLSPTARTATLPLHQGVDQFGNPVYFIVTEASDCATAQSLQVNYAPKLGLLIDANGNPVNQSAQKVTVTPLSGNGADPVGMVQFSGTADFSPVRIFVPNSPNGWPPVQAAPGSVGDSNYTPFITYKNAAGKPVVLNASQVANATGIKDFIPQIDFANKTVTFNLVVGIYDFNFLMYLRMDASDATVTAFEGGIYASNPEASPGGGMRFLAQGSARQTIMPVVNGPRGVDKILDRQGLESGALGEGDPLNVLGAKPGDDEYSPLWDITPVVWTPAAIATGKRQRLHQDDEVRAFVAAGLLTSVPGASGPVNSDIGVTSLGVVSNCPVMLRVVKGLLPY